MKTIHIGTKEGREMQKPFLNSADKKRLGITGYQLVTEWGWHIAKETDSAIMLSGIAETGAPSNREYEGKAIWLPKSQILVFEYEDNIEAAMGGELRQILVFVKSWLFNKKKSEIELHHFRNYAY